MIVVVMGVSGCGKTTVGAMLARRQGWQFIDADDHHPAANIAKMSQGIPLQDDDRWPWLAQLNVRLRDVDLQGEHAVLACSALKQRYRDRIAGGLADLRWIFLNGSFALIESRLRDRRDHYMKPGLLRSQFDALEPPVDALELDVAPTPETLLNVIEAHLFTKTDEASLPCRR
ncbi:MAG: gluconokinase [Betaproteobacteria bacterium]|nr:gluconokinase [Betaproteobacteria bacterium]